MMGIKNNNNKTEMMGIKNNNNKTEMMESRTAPLKKIKLTSIVLAKPCVNVSYAQS